MVKIYIFTKENTIFKIKPPPLLPFPKNKNTWKQKTQDYKVQTKMAKYNYTRVYSHKSVPSRITRREVNIVEKKTMTKTRQISAVTAFNISNFYYMPI